MKICIIIFFLFSLNKIQAQNSVVDSLFKLTAIDTSSFTRIFFVSDIIDSARFKFHQNADSTFCSDRPIFVPIFSGQVSTPEYDSLMKYSPEKNEEYFFNFLEDNSIYESLNKVSADSSLSSFLIERLGTDVHVDFGERISTSVYKDGFLRYYFNNECARRLGFISHRFFFYKDKKLIKEIQVIDNNSSKPEIKIWQNDN